MRNQTTTFETNSNQNGIRKDFDQSIKSEVICKPHNRNNKKCYNKETNKKKIGELNINNVMITAAQSNTNDDNDVMREGSIFRMFSAKDKTNHERSKPSMERVSLFHRFFVHLPLF